MGLFMKIVKPILKGILNTILFPLKPIIEPIIHLMEALLQLQELIVKFAMKVIPAFIQLFFYILEPGKLIKDVIYAFVTGFKMIIKAVVDTLMGKSIGLLNLHVKDDSNNKTQKGDTEECLAPSLLEILILVLCPPLAIFIRKGLKGFFTIVITAVLTYYYYLPGLVYASLYVL
jgi:uncharacterized membrane protein YqaE (UPF0057 family)